MMFRNLFRRNNSSLEGNQAKEDRVGPEVISIPNCKNADEGDLLRRNAVLHNCQSGRRCFIICNGPSVKIQDLKSLRGEFLISVSSGYHHPNYALVSPTFHCLPQVTYSIMKPSDTIAWFSEMHNKLGDTTLVLSKTEKKIVEDNNLFQGRQLYYLDLTGNFADLTPETIPDLTNPTPAVQSVSIMALLLAMWCGSKNIYLIGTDHDHFRTREYKYFYEPTLLKGKDPGVDPSGKLIGNWHDEFHALASLWSQYRTVKNIAISNGISIVNSTAGGELDEFPRQSLEDVLSNG